jgi:hypothetical protein
MKTKKCNDPPKEQQVEHKTDKGPNKHGQENMEE